MTKVTRPSFPTCNAESDRALFHAQDLQLCNR